MEAAPDGMNRLSCRRHSSPTVGAVHEQCIRCRLLIRKVLCGLPDPADVGCRIGWGPCRDTTATPSRNPVGTVRSEAYPAGDTSSGPLVACSQDSSWRAAAILRPFTNAFGLSGPSAAPEAQTREARSQQAETGRFWRTRVAALQGSTKGVLIHCEPGSRRRVRPCAAARSASRWRRRTKVRPGGSPRDQPRGGRGGDGALHGRRLLSMIHSAASALSPEDRGARPSSTAETKSSTQG